MRIIVDSMRDIIIFSLLALLSTFGLPLITHLIVPFYPEFNFIYIEFRGYFAWLLFWHLVWIFVDAAFNHVTIKFIYDSYLYIRCSINR